MGTVGSSKRVFILASLEIRTFGMIGNSDVRMLKLNKNAIINADMLESMWTCVFKK